ncbi:helix-turn-helix domain-containing protein [Streptomyces sp. NPDC058326]|uniref:helix-turn-helix domain-containing protein n=1 Tax=Streptomyces sp. NPDC058326 TaxID=3346447 RepID=UPI0036E5A4AF
MTPGEHTPDPRGARTPAEFLARLQALKDWSGLTYRELSARAEERGDVLPRSTVANMLARPTLPREELLTSFVRACGVSPAALEEWRTVRRELAAPGMYAPTDAGGAGEGTAADPVGAGTAAGPAAGTADEAGATDPAGPATDQVTATTAAAGPTDPPAARVTATDRVTGADPAAEGPAGAVARAVGGPADTSASPAPWPAAAEPPDGPPMTRRATRRSRIRRALVATVAVAGLVLAGVSLVTALRDGRTGPAGQQPRTPAAPVPPAAGDVRVRVAGTEFCLGERRGTRTGQVHQLPCAGAGVPLYSLAEVAGGRWRIVSDHPDYGPGCSGIPSGGRIPDAPYEDSECGDPSRVEAFALEPYGTPVRGYRIVPVDSATPGTCVTVVGDRTAAWARLAQAPCAPDAAGQLFSFERRP